MDSLDRVLMQMDLQFVGNAQHKITPAALMADEQAVLLDVRTEEEVATVSCDFHYHLRSLHVPLHRLPVEFQQVPVDRNVGIFCPLSVRAAVAYTYLRSKGYKNVYVLDGGLAALIDEAGPGPVLAKLEAIQ
ncbi:MAG: rhodanese-like domain-containing protein [Thermodesulfobacteriota bacterium]|nr:rhodanese-like domain-containing protein [Thermodesulfobacteriota bacterium]